MKTEKFLIITNNPIEWVSHRKAEWDSYKQLSLDFNIDLKNGLISGPSEGEYRLSMYKEIEDRFLPHAAYLMLSTSSDYVMSIVNDMTYRGTKLLNSTNSLVGDKLLLSVEAKHNNIPIPKTVGINIPNIFMINSVAEYIIDSIGLPCVIKKTDWGLGIGIVKVNTYNELTDILGLISTSKLVDMQQYFRHNYIAQEFIPDNVGTSIRVIVLNNKCIGAMLRSNSSYWKSNSYSSDTISTFYPMNSILEELSLRICKIFNITYAGLDFHIMNDGSYLLGEINLSPQIKSFSEVHPNISIPKMILQYLMPHKF